MTITLREVKKSLHAYADRQKADFLPRFFKTGKGEYGYGDQFIGVTVPNTRKVARIYANLGQDDIESLLYSPIHEERLLGLLILILQYQQGNDKDKENIASFYIKHISQVNNWDLVDVSADKILGPHCELHGNELLFRFAHSKDLWKRRIAMVSTYHYIKKRDATIALEIATILKDDSHDLIQKVVGWMLREVGKRCTREIEEEFLNKYAATMPRTMLRYAIERFEPNQKRYYMMLGK